MNAGTVLLFRKFVKRGDGSFVQKVRYLLNNNENSERGDGSFVQKFRYLLNNSEKSKDPAVR